MNKESRGNEAESIDTRIAVGFGDVYFLFERDPQGAIVDIVARLSSMAHPGQILVHESAMSGIEAQLSRNGHEILGDQRLGIRGALELQRVGYLDCGEQFESITAPRTAAPIRNYQYSGTIAPLSKEDASLRLRRDFYRYTFLLQYQAYISSNSLIFATLSSPDEVSCEDVAENVLARWIVKQPPNYTASERREFDRLSLDVTHLSVDGALTYRREKPSVTHKSPYHSREIVFTRKGAPTMGAFVPVSFRFSTLLSRTRCYLLDVVDTEVEGFEISLDISATGHRDLTYFAFMPTGRTVTPLEVIREPSNHPTKIRLKTSGRVSHMSGVVFGWPNRLVDK